MANEQRLTLDRFPHTISVPVRWNDYDIANHVNNVQFYVYFEEAVVSLLDLCGLDWLNDPIIAYVVESKCQFLAPIRYPSQLTAGIGVERLGNSSLTYSIALFVEGQDKPVGVGHFVHVFVDRKTDQSVAMPDSIRMVAQQYLMPS